MGGKKTKRRLSLKRIAGVVKSIKTWHLIVILIPMLFLLATLLRLDHIEMTRLRKAVEEIDAAGDDVQVAGAVDELKRFTFSHTVINITEQNGLTTVSFGTGPFYLSNQYYRKAAAILAEAEANVGDDSNPNGNVYAAAMNVCKPQAIANHWIWSSPGYIACMTGEINKHPTSEAITETIRAELPDPGLYRYEFASPLWTPSWSGLVSLICLVLIAWIIIRIIGWIIIHIAIAVFR